MIDQKSVNGLHRASHLLALASGGMILLPVVAAATFAGLSSPFAVISMLIVAAWLISNLIALGCVRSRPSFAAGGALLGSAPVAVLSGYSLVYSLNHEVFDPLYFTAPVPIWLWVLIPFFFNSLQTFLSASRLFQLRTSR